MDLNLSLRGLLPSHVGPREFHYLPDSEPKGNWTVACYSSQADSQRAWKVIEHAAVAGLLQTYTPDKTNTPTLSSWPAIPCGAITPSQSAFNRSVTKARAVVFRCENSRRYYFSSASKVPEPS